MKAFFLIMISSLLICCKTNEVIKTNNFEGKIFYNIEYPNQKIINEDVVATNYVVYYKNGHIKKEYRNKKDSLLSYTIYDPKCNLTLNFTKDNDTVLYYYPEQQYVIDNNLTLLEDNETKSILGYSCKKGNFVAMDNDYTYFFSEDLRIDTSGINGASHNILFKDYVILKYIITEPGIKEVTATQIIHEKLDYNIFKKDTLNKVMIELE